MSPSLAALDRTGLIDNEKRRFTLGEGFYDVHDNRDDSDYFVHCSHLYIAAIGQYDNVFRALAHEDPLMLVLPVLEIYTTFIWGDLEVQDRCIGFVRQSWKQRQTLLERSWNRLRVLKHEGGRPFECFRKYDRDHNKGRAQQKAACIDLFQRWDCIIKEIDRTEQLARDYLQAYVGWLSLEESRASIKQSKIALEEGKRTKLSKYRHSA
ncbi:hypothetical protein A1O3_10138 [Capronia epimyces CBS 606.96]|uniref:Uncharacterized protein n=1 Tax=Capronia epimyces CBS 606.96 TaxID=1182542 RepID=W9XJ36_9EURO|nr:uncharacterized protein A1O3_10138 [Capronia epimyces CBS 606.96]EXJ76981.1 hypothetical protein A1O3_10138 [Capronia epimyces CBS 606.96]